MDQELPTGYLTFKEFLKLWIGSEKTLRRRLSDGTIPKYQPGGPGTLIGIPISVLDIASTKQNKSNPDTQINKNNVAQIPGPKPSWRK